MAKITRVAGAAIHPWLDELAKLRIRIFREFPYLYDGDMEYERSYLANYADSANSLFVLAQEGNKVIGVSTGLPLSDADEEFLQPFRDRRISAGNVFYFGESVLEPEFRGQGLGHCFFDERESFARELGYSVTAFCTVDRPLDHPMRPPGYRPMDLFWVKRGYIKYPNMVTQYSWKDIGDSAASSKPMIFWLRPGA
ncbi:GNAT family N-acetyltransferase [Hahella sp. HN01]|uniref:GNAT family N-acetyltransferase n=1 Tax=Hahella sp. HN01 TaxID=2847262 RepID=UPI001C1EA9AB|nr:GNAT family N-acetyltransferase [Hahella sp. HN01]MBU6951092.1 GNAT family N-acetyltransferase [Hahella sp. HN01]